MAKGVSINDAIHGLIHMTEYERRIISTPAFNRLHDIYQNSTLYMTFPCNRTKRFEHSIGTMKLCSDMFYYSILNAEQSELESFFVCASNHISKIIDALNEKKLGGFDFDDHFAGKSDWEINVLNSIEMDERRKAFVPHSVPEKYAAIQVVLMEAIRTAALLHDIGHPPFSHIPEFALKKVYEEVRKKSDNDLTKRERDFLKALNPCFQEEDGKPAKKLHERMGELIAEVILKAMVKRCANEDVHGDWSLVYENIFSAVVYDIVMGMYREKPFFSALHRIVDGDIDGDRLDYLTRDARNSGVDVGKIDYSRLITDMRLYHVDNENEAEEDNRFYFCLPIKAINSVEDFFMRRYNLYRDIIYHHHVTKTDFLLQTTVYELTVSYLSQKQTAPSEDRSNLTPFDISGLWHPLREKQLLGREQTQNNLVLWNDAWLMTVLKQAYYWDYGNMEKAAQQKPEREVRESGEKIYRHLSELLLNKKYYVSLTKRGNDFKRLDNAIKDVLRSRKKEIDELIGNVLRSHEISTDRKKEKGREPALDGTIRVIREMQECCESGKIANGFVASILNNKFDAIREKDETFYDIVQNAVEAGIAEVCGKNRIKVAEHIVAPVVFKAGIGTRVPIYFYGLGASLNNGEDVCTERGEGIDHDEDNRFAVLTDVSGIVEILNYELLHFPPFYLYIMLEEPKKNTPELEREFLASIGKKIGEIVFRKIQAVFTDHALKKSEEEQK